MKQLELWPSWCDTLWAKYCGWAVVRGKRVSWAGFGDWRRGKR